MSPIPRHAVKLTQRIRNPTLRNLTLCLIEDASQKPDLAHFTIAILKQATIDTVGSGLQYLTSLTLTETHRTRAIPTSNHTPQHCLQPRNNSKTTRLKRLTVTGASYLRHIELSSCSRSF